MSTCLTCRHWQPRQSPAIAAHGFAPCALGSAATFQSHRACCPRQTPAQKAIVQNREQWASKSGLISVPPPP